MQILALKRLMFWQISTKKAVISVKKSVHVNIGSDAANVHIFGYSTGQRRTMTLPAGLGNTVIVPSLP